MSNNIFKNNKVDIRSLISSKDKTNEGSDIKLEDIPQHIRNVLLNTEDTSIISPSIEERVSALEEAVTDIILTQMEV